MIFELELDETKTMGSLLSSNSGLIGKKFDFGTGVHWLDVGFRIHKVLQRPIRQDHDPPRREDLRMYRSFITHLGLVHVLASLSSQR